MGNSLLAVRGINHKYIVVGRNISKAAKIRHASDYDEFYIASKEETEKQIQTAKTTIDLVDKYISEK